MTRPAAVLAMIAFNIVLLCITGIVQYRILQRQAQIIAAQKEISAQQKFIDETNEATRKTLSKLRGLPHPCGSIIEPGESCYVQIPLPPDASALGLERRPGGGGGTEPEKRGDGL